MDEFTGPDILQLAQLLKPSYEDDFDDKQKVKPVKSSKCAILYFIILTLSASRKGRHFEA